jgi:SAM (Sterile alpha motif) domain-containing protein
MPEIDITDWLRKLRLERYEAAFRDNEIDWEALPKLTAEDLKDLRVVLGTTANDCSTRLWRSAPRRPTADLAAVAPDPAVQTDAERRNSGRFAIMGLR